MADHPADPVEVLADVEDADLPEHIEQVYSRWAAAGVRHGEGSPEERRAGRELSVALARRSIAALTAAGVPPTPVGQVVLEDGAWRVSAGNPEFVPRWAVLVPEPFDPKHPPHYLRPVGPTTAEEER